MFDTIDTIQMVKKAGNKLVGFPDIKRFLIDHPDFQAQTNDMIVALHFLSQYFNDPSPISLVGGIGVDAKEYDWRDMLCRFDWSSNAVH